MIKLLIVDDSAFMRMAIRKMVGSLSEIAVVGEAKTGKEALQMVAELQPDVITMDVEMPEMDGITATEEIMKNWPRPIIMVSTMTQKDAETTIRALELGAVDFISKKSSFVQIDIVQIGKELTDKIVFWAKRYNRAGAKAQAVQAPTRPLNKVEPSKVDLILLGVSTGGPAAISQLLKDIGPLTCPLVIAQHMPAVFTKGFAEHLKRESGLEVVEGEYGMVLKPGLVVIAPGGTDTLIREPAAGSLTINVQLREEMIVHPSVDVLFQSVTGLSVNPVAVVMTGMGSDGVNGALALRKAKNCPVLVQEPASCVIDGMPSSVIAAGGATEVLDLKGIARRLSLWAGLNNSSVN